MEDENFLNNEVGGGKSGSRELRRGCVKGEEETPGWRCQLKKGWKTEGNKRTEIPRYLRENMRFVCVLFDTIIPSNKKRTLNCNQVVMPTEV